jgi:hypothetical protein
MPTRAAAGRDRLEHRQFLAPDHAVLAGVRVEPGERQSRRPHAEARQPLGSQLDGVAQPPAGEDDGHLRQRHVHGGQHDAQGR